MEPLIEQESNKPAKINLNLSHLNKDVDLTESTDGFVTQINAIEDETSRTSIAHNENQDLLIASEIFYDNKKLKKEIFHTPSLRNLNKNYEFVIPALRSHTNSFVTAKDKQDPYKDDSKTTFEHFPNIQTEIKKTFYPKNIFNRRVYVNYLTSKIEREKVKGNLQKNQVKNSKTQNNHDHKDLTSAPSPLNENEPKPNTTAKTGKEVKTKILGSEILNLKTENPKSPAKSQKVVVCRRHRRIVHGPLKIQRFQK